MKKFLKTKKKFKAKSICHECYSEITITKVEYFKSIIYCPFCGKRMWLRYLRDKEYWMPKCVQASIKNFDKGEENGK